MINQLFSKKSGKLKTGYKRDYMNIGCDVDFEGPIIHASAVLGYEGWLAGYQMAFDTAKSKLAQNNFALGYRAGDFQLHTNVWVILHTYINSLWRCFVAFQIMGITYLTSVAVVKALHKNLLGGSIFFKGCSNPQTEYPHIGLDLLLPLYPSTPIATTPQDLCLLPSRTRLFSWKCSLGTDLNLVANCPSDLKHIFGHQLLISLWVVISGIQRGMNL